MPVTLTPQQPTPELLRLAEQQDLAEPIKVFLAESDTGAQFSVLLTRDEMPGDSSPRWHISIAGRDGQVPEWNDFAAIVHEVRPGVPFVMGVPPKSWWLNINEAVLHAWESRDQTLTDQWRREARGDQPT